MRAKRSRLLVLVVALAAVVVALVWLFASSHNEAGEEEEEQVTAAAPQLAHASNGEAVVVISRDEQTRIGLETETLTATTHAHQLIAYGTILNPAPLAALNAQLVGQTATFSASRAEYARARLLYSEKRNVSLKDLQTARAKYQADQAQLNLLQQRLTDTWGARIADLKPGRRAELVDNLITRANAIARVSVPSGEAVWQTVASAYVVILGYGAHPLAALSIWPAPTVNPNLQGQSFFLEVRAHGMPLRPGAAVTAYLRSSSAPQRGVIIPMVALVNTHGRSWAYVQVAPTRFERRPVALSQSTPGGWFVTAGFVSGDRVVVSAAQALLSEEFKSNIRVED